MVTDHYRQWIREGLYQYDSTQQHKVGRGIDDVLVEHRTDAGYLDYNLKKAMVPQHCMTKVGRPLIIFLTINTDFWSQPLPIEGKGTRFHLFLLLGSMIVLQLIT